MRSIGYLLTAAAQTSVAVRVKDEAGQLLYINDSRHPVLDSKTPVDVDLIAVEATPQTGDLPAAFAGQVWLWLAFEDSASGAESNDITAGDPVQYSLELMADDIYVFQADCNSGSGQYTLEGSNLTLLPGAMTLAACGPDSLSDTYVSLLSVVVTFMFDSEGNLVLNLKGDAGNMIFSAPEYTTTPMYLDSFTV